MFSTATRVKQDQGVSMLGCRQLQEAGASCQLPLYPAASQLPTYYAGPSGYDGLRHSGPGEVVQIVCYQMPHACVCVCASNEQHNNSDHVLTLISAAERAAITANPVCGWTHCTLYMLQQRSMMTH